ncbi:MAG TPA: GMC oxidoreductase [Labilithrix sp.]|nr:GMC oxidoreductase [Labilithrix sp.]
MFLKAATATGTSLMLPNCALDPSESSRERLGKTEDPLYLFADWQYRAQVPEIFEPTPVPPSFTKAIVIGSGFGGAISALRLAQAGIETTVLERGSRWPSHPRREIFANDYLPDGRGYWHRTSAKLPVGLTASFKYFGGVFDLTEYPNIDIFRAACVGGGSRVFTGVMIQPREEYFKAIFGAHVDYAEMNRVYYPRVRNMLRLSALPADLYAKPDWGHSRAWDQHAKMAGYTPSSVESIWNWDVVRKEYSLFNRRSATIGESSLGNSNGAKFDLTQNYLKYAEDTGLAKVYPGTQVLGITRDAQGRYLVEVAQLDPFGTVLRRHTLACEYLFLAAGSIGTSELLVRARARRDLPNLDENIGEGWGTNGDTQGVRSLGFSDGAFQAAPCASAIHDTRPGLPVTLENWYAVSIPVNLGVLPSFGMVFDMSNRGRFVYDETTDSVTLSWAASGNDDAIAVTKVVHDRLVDASHTIAGIPGLLPGVSAPSTGHPLGGAVLGKATDNYGRVNGYTRLYVMDGAMVPGSTGAANPSLTISALAERNIEKIVQNDF